MPFGKRGENGLDMAAGKPALFKAEAHTKCPHSTSAPRFPPNMFARAALRAAGASAAVVPRIGGVVSHSMWSHASVARMSGTIGSMLDANVASRGDREVFKAVQQGLAWDYKELQV